MSKKISNLESAATVAFPATGGIFDTAASVVAIDITALGGAWVTLQAFTYDVDVYKVEQIATPTTAPVIAATALGTAAVGRRIVVGTDKDFFVPRVEGSQKLWLVTKALGVGTLRVLPS